MNVVYDLLGFQSREHGERGIARYVLHLALAMERTSPGLVTQYLVHPHLPFPPGAEPLVATGRVVRADRHDGVRQPSAGGVFVAGSPFEDFNVASDVVFPRWARSPHWRIAAVLYDLIPGKFPELYLKTDLDRRNYQARLSAVGSVDWLLAISEASARDVVEMIDFDRRRVTVIGAGADSRFRPSPLGPREVAAELVRYQLVPGLRPGYVFLPTGLDPRKNLERTFEAYGRLPAELRRRHQLVLTCRLGAHGRQYLDELAGAAGVADDLLATGYVSDDTLCRLYQGAHLVVFPSLYEGFGLPALEAMTCRAPVIVADSSSLREVQTVAEARFDPTSVDSMAAAMHRALGDDGLLRSLRDQPLPPFSWDNAARLAAGVIAGLRVARTTRAVAVGGGARPRLALVSPLPPATSTAASRYARRLVDELRHHCDLTVFVDSDPDLVDAADGVVVAPTRQLELIARSGGAFDRVLYLVANGASHVGVLAALRSHPGWVLFHDVQLTELYRHVHQVAPEQLVDGSVGATLAAFYPDRYRPNIEQMPAIPQDVADRFGILLAREAVACAEGVLVHSSYEARLIELDTGVTPVAAYPRPCPLVPALDHRRARPPQPVVASFGPPPRLPQAETLLQALALVRRQVPGARLRFVGPLDDPQRRRLTKLARRAGVRGAIELVEPVDDEGYATARIEASVAVQLQNPSAGVAAAEVAALLAAGVPTVVPDLGPMTELPDDVVVKVDAAGGAAGLGEVIAGLLSDREGRDACSQSARDYAKASSFASAAESLLEVLFA